MAISHIKFQKALLVICDNCFLDISNVTRIKCADCTCDMCTSCFLNRAETSIHRVSHRFHVISSLGGVLYDDNWTIFEEMMFLEGLKMYGIGNWIDISTFVSNKSDNECEKHFLKIFDINDNKTLEIKDLNVKSSNPHRSEVLSFLSNRKEFEIEYLNNFEASIKDLVILDDDKEQDVELKRAFLDAYKRVLELREYRTYMCIDRELVNIQNVKRNDDIYNNDKVKCLLPFLSKEDYNRLYNGIYKEDKLKELISNLVDTAGTRDDTISKNIFRDKFFSDESSLSRNEISFCEANNLRYNRYMSIKCEIIEHLVYNERIDILYLCNSFGCSKELAVVLFDFFMKQGWITC